MTKPVLAVVSPLPPSQTGVAGYSARLLRHLAKHWDITVFIDDLEPDARLFVEGVSVRRLSSWTWWHTLMPPDRLLLCLGNSRYHQAVPAMALRHGGVILAHDVRMTAFQCLLAAGTRDRHALSRVVAERHGEELARDIRLIEDRVLPWVSFAEVRRRLEQANAFLLAPSVVGADLVLVHSQNAARLARLDVGRELAVEVTPFGYPMIKVKDERRQPSLISTFGLVAPEKEPFLLVEALPFARRIVASAILDFNGEVNEGLLADIERTAKALHLGEAVHFQGRLDDQAQLEAFAASSLAVQLRATVNGESSAAVAECLAAAIPVIVTDVGAQAELPSDVVQKVPVGVSPLELGTTMGELMSDHEYRDALRKRGADFAAANSFKRAAEAITRALLDSPAPRL